MFRLFQQSSLASLTLLSYCTAKPICEAGAAGGKDYPGPSDINYGALVTGDTYISAISTGGGEDDAFIVYDSRTRNPRCVVQLLNQSNQQLNGDKPNIKRPPFFVDSHIIGPNFRVSSQDYNNSKFDRGHMLPAADFKASSDSWRFTFSMANVCPQDPHLNKTFWAKFEAWVRNLLVEDCDEVMVFTGPVYAPTLVGNDDQWVYVSKTIGTFPKLIQIPSHFFKVIVGKGKKGRFGKESGGNRSHTFIGAFMVPNVEGVHKQTSLKECIVSLNELEAIVGFRILPYAISESTRQSLDAVVPPERFLSRVLRSDTDSEWLQSNQIPHPARAGARVPDIKTIAGGGAPKQQQQQQQGGGRTSMDIDDSTRGRSQLARVTSGSSCSSSSSLGQVDESGKQEGYEFDKPLHLCRLINCNGPLVFSKLPPQQR